MNIAADPELQKLNRLLQLETDPEKIVQLADEFNRRLQQLHDAEQPKSDRVTGTAA
jgi:hypothetical protein